MAGNFEPNITPRLSNLHGSVGERDSGKLYTRTLGVLTQLGMHPIISVPSVLRHWARTGSRRQAAPASRTPATPPGPKPSALGSKPRPGPGSRVNVALRTSRLVPASLLHKELGGGRVGLGAGPEWGSGGRAARRAPTSAGPSRVVTSHFATLPRTTLAVRRPRKHWKMGRGAWGLSLRLSLHRGPGHPASFGDEQRAGQRGFEARCRRRYGAGRGRSRGAPRPARRSPRPWSHCPGAPHSLSSPRKLSRGRRWGCGRPAFRTLGLVGGGRGRGGGGGPGAVRLPHFSRKPGNPLGPCWRGRCQGVLCAVDCERPGPKASARRQERPEPAPDSAGLVGARRQRPRGLCAQAEERGSPAGQPRT